MPDPVLAGGHWVHSIDPFALHISGNFGIRWYGISYLVGIVVGWWLLARWSRSGRLPVHATKVGDFAVTIAIGMLLGGRLGYAIFYRPELFTSFTPTLPWWELLAVHQGGMASHGGIAGMALATLWWSVRQRQSMAVLGDALAAVGTFGIACGRLANFINGELWGRPWDGAWAVIFPDAARHPLELGGNAAYAWQVAHEVANPARHPSQLYAMVLEGLLPFAVLMWVHARHRRPGLTLGLFFLLYGVGRFFGEFFREPDAGQPGYGDIPGILGFMSKGQAITLPLFAIGIVLVWWAMKRQPRPELYPSTEPTA